LGNFANIGDGVQERLSRHEQTVNAIADVVNIWLMDSPALNMMIVGILDLFNYLVVSLYDYVLNQTLSTHESNE
jgi:hypothetical protein